MTTLGNTTTRSGSFTRRAVEIHVRRSLQKSPQDRPESLKSFPPAAQNGGLAAKKLQKA